MSDWQPKPSPFLEHKLDVFKKMMVVARFIYQIGETEQLRLPSNNVENITGPDTQSKINYVKDCLQKYRELTGKGRGIAAVQVGIPERFAVIYTPKKLITIINPTITKTAKKKLSYPEMCMSANPIIAPVVRPAWIEFTYVDEKGKEQQWKIKDETEIGRMLNRVFQHEIDHMNGIINIDKVPSKDLILESDPDFYKHASFVEV